MRKLLYISLAVVAFASFSSSCKKCATCTYQDALLDSTIVSDFCEKNHVYDNELQSHIKAGYTCAED